MLIDWLAAGLDPTRATLFIQSRVTEHAELTLLLGMITPIGWLERVPTYKDQQQKLADRDLSNYGFLGYPVMQARRHPDLSREHGAGRRGPGVARRARARDRAPLQPHLRPRAGLRGQGEGRGQEARQPRRRAATTELRTAFQEKGDDAALEAARELLNDTQNLALGDRERLFGYLEGSRRVILPEPQALLTETPKVPGLDGQKMSKSYGNAILLREDPAEVTKKIRTMQTDPARVRRTDPGNPETLPGVAAAPDLLRRRRRATGSSRAARRRASAASNASSR